MSERSAGDVTFDGVWKQFRVGDKHDSLRDLLPALARRVAGRARGAPARPSGAFWALRDVSFRVRPGEALGIMGPNGAGKSTILKLLTGILEPTAGRAATAGRVGALIEVSAGFHPDLTGRENVYLQGAFMGMRRAEIARRFDEIVAFAGVEAFIDTPVKRYSSGMNARLGFAVAAHLEPDVLIVDEVLAVGDAAFQRKALARIGELVRRGIPVVVVTHQLEQITALCTHALVLERGQVVLRGTPAECVNAYLSRTFATGAGDGDSALDIRSVEPDGPTTVASGEGVAVRVHCWVRHPDRTGRQRLSVRVRAPDGAVLFAAPVVPRGAPLPTERWFEVRATLQLNLPPGSYVVESYVSDDATGADVEHGPMVGVTVVGGPPFAGTVQMHLAAELTFAGIYGEAQGWQPPPAAGALVGAAADAR